jgi:hypothetical protein
MKRDSIPSAIWPILALAAIYLLTLHGGLIALIDGAIPAVLRPQPVFWAWISVFVYLYLASIASRKSNPLYVVLGEDGLLSASKFQFFLWTGITLFAFVWIVAERAAHGLGNVTLPDLPKNVLIAMGFSVTTLAAAKGITVAYTNSGRVTKPLATAEPSTDLAALVAHDDLKQPDLVKIQMLTWTLIGAVVYLARVVSNIDKYAVCRPQTECFPDIDAVLMVLMGLGQGAYLGGKLTTADTPTVATVSPNPALPGSEVTISGISFGPSPLRGAIGFGAMQSPLVAKSWSDGAIVVDIPLNNPSNAPWKGGETVDIVLLIDGSRVQGDSVITIGLPDVTNAQVVPTDPRVILIGGPFGPQVPSSFVTIGTEIVAANDPRVVDWKSSRVEILKPGIKGRGLPVFVTANGYKGQNQLVTL